MGEAKNWPLVRFSEWTCQLVVGKYSDGTPKLTLIDAKDRFPVAHCTISSVDMESQEALPDGQVYIKSYSENQGMIEALEQACIVRRTGRYVKTGYVTVPVADVLIDVGNDVDRRGGADRGPCVHAVLDSGSCGICHEKVE